MKTRSNIVYNLFSLGKINSPDLNDLFNKSFTFDINGFIITNYQLGENTINFNITRRVPTTIFDFDHGLNKMIKKTIFIYSSFRITIIVDINICILWGNLTTFNSFKSICRREFPNIVFHNIKLTPYEIFKRICNNGIKFKIERITINNYSPKEGITGKYSCYVDNNNQALDLIETSHETITYLKLQVYPKNSDFFELYISSNNNLGITDLDDSKLDNIKNILKIIIL